MAPQSPPQRNISESNESSPHFVLVEATNSGIQIIGDWEQTAEATAEATTIEESSTTSVLSSKSESETSLSSEDSVIMTKDPETGHWECKPYKTQLLRAAISEANKSDGDESYKRIIAQLTELGVNVYVIPHQTLGNMMEDIAYVIRMVAKGNRCGCHAQNQSCLLYQDQQGRLYNLTIEDHAIGISNNWKACVAGFSGFQAMVALAVLIRTFSCASDDEIDGKLDLIRPGTALVLVLGLVLSEETSLSWINSAMFVRGVPSISAHCLSQFVGNDWVRKLMILSLSLASTYTGTTQRVLTIMGVGLACVALLANLGARSWHFLKWNPLQYSGFGAPIVAYLAAIGVGILFPYMGHRGIEVGGKAAIENVLKTAVLVAFFFLLSDVEEIREHLVVGSRQCDQQKVNIIVGAWWSATLLMCMYLVRLIPTALEWPHTDGELLLEEDQSSPVGFRVPHLPVFPLKPHLAKKGLSFCSLWIEIVLGVVLALGLGAVIVYAAVEDGWFGRDSSS